MGISSAQAWIKQLDSAMGCNPVQLVSMMLLTLQSMLSHNNQLC